MLNSENKKGIVIECYDHDESHRVLVIQSSDEPWAKEYHFFYIPKTPEVNFGDIVQMNFANSKFYVYRGSSRLSYKITPSPFPGSLLWELISEKLNSEDQL
jgi:hypothetical protein